VVSETRGESQGHDDGVGVANVGSVQRGRGHCCHAWLGTAGK
jgi:hypothetical protein